MGYAIQYDRIRKEEDMRKLIAGIFVFVVAAIGAASWTDNAKPASWNSAPAKVVQTGYFDGD